MVNKQYNVETLKKEKNNSKKMLDKSSEICSQNSKNLDNGKDILKNSNLKELSKQLSDIGRFQYILQMDKEMENHTSAKNYKSNLQRNIFWEPSILPSSTKHTSKQCQFSKIIGDCFHRGKWPFTLLIILGLVAIILYCTIDTFSKTEINLIEESLQQNNSKVHTSHFVQNKSAKYNLIKLINKSSDLMKQINENQSSLYEVLNEKTNNKSDESITGKPNIFKTNPTWETIQQQYEFTSGHQNNFGIPIEEDERMLNFLKAKNKKKGITPSSTESHYVSPTLPNISNKLKDNIHQNYTEDGLCQSTSLSFCKGNLHYDLTTVENKSNNLTDLEIEHIEYLLNSECSARSAEFICIVLEPECRSIELSVLKPCKRLCKSILEKCSHIISSSEGLTSIFDCDSYLDSSDKNICEDTTRHGSGCYSNEFQCADKSCIPMEWKCDNIKDCSAGGDEENCKFCEIEEFRCISDHKCIPYKWRCDQYNDCSDESDEFDCDYSDDYFSTTNPFETKSYWKKTKEIETYGTTTENYQTTDTNLNNSEEIPNESESKVVTTIKKFGNFQDSKEIMMTSDTEGQYKYTSTDQFRLTTSRSSMPCAEDELRCVSGRCISSTQLCDKIMDCPDAADEAMCIFKN